MVFLLTPPRLEENLTFQLVLAPIFFYTKDEIYCKEKFLTCVRGHTYLQTEDNASAGNNSIVTQESRMAKTFWLQT